MGSFVTHLSCPRCGAEHQAVVPQTICSCGSPLLVEYDLERVAHTVSKGAVAGRPPTMWRYRELLPAGNPADVVSLGEGFTPLLPLRALGTSLGLHDLWVKDEGANPTGT